MRTVWTGATFLPRWLLRGMFFLFRLRSSNRRLLTRVVLSGLLLFALSGYVRERAGMDDFLADGIEFMRNAWHGRLGFLDRAPWLIFGLVKGFDVALVWLFLRAVATFHMMIPHYIDSFVVLRVNLRQGVSWTSRMQLRMLLALPISVTLTIVWRGYWSLLAFGFSLFFYWYLGAALNPNLDRLLDLLNRAMVGDGDNES